MEKRYYHIEDSLLDEEWESSELASYIEHEDEVEFIEGDDRTHNEATTDIGHEIKPERGNDNDTTPDFFEFYELPSPIERDVETEPTPEPILIATAFLDGENIVVAHRSEGGTELTFNLTEALGEEFPDDIERITDAMRNNEDEILGIISRDETLDTEEEVGHIRSVFYLNDDGTYRQEFESITESRDIVSLPELSDGNDADDDYLEAVPIVQQELDPFPILLTLPLLPLPKEKQPVIEEQPLSLDLSDHNEVIPIPPIYLETTPAPIVKMVTPETTPGPISPPERVMHTKPQADLSKEGFSEASLQEVPSSSDEGEPQSETPILDETFLPVALEVNEATPLTTRQEIGARDELLPLSRIEEPTPKQDSILESGRFTTHISQNEPVPRLPEEPKGGLGEVAPLTMPVTVIHPAQKNESVVGSQRESEIHQEPKSGSPAVEVTAKPSPQIAQQEALAPMTMAQPKAEVVVPVVLEKSQLHHALGEKIRESSQPQNERVEAIEERVKQSGIDALQPIKHPQELSVLTENKEESHSFRSEHKEEENKMASTNNEAQLYRAAKDEQETVQPKLTSALTNERVIADWQTDFTEQSVHTANKTTQDSPHEKPVLPEAPLNRATTTLPDDIQQITIPVHRRARVRRLRKNVLRRNV